MKLSAKLSLIMLALSLLPLTAVGVLAFERGRQTIEQDTIDRLLTTSLLKESELNLWIEHSVRDTRILAQRPLLTQVTASLLAHESTDEIFKVAYNQIQQEHFAPRISESTDFENLSLIRATDGLILISTDASLEGKYRESRTFFKEGLNNTYVGNATYDVSQRRQVMYISTPIKDETGTTIAILAAQLQLAQISRIMAQNSGIHESEVTYLVNTFNFMITESQLESGTNPDRAVYTDGVNNCLAHRNGSGSYTDSRGISVIGAYRWMPERELCIVTELDESEALRPIIDLRNSILVIGTMIGFGVLVLGVFFARTITTPVRRLVRGTQEIAAGNLTYQVGSSATDEIGLLSQAFDQMVNTLQQTTVSRDELAQEVIERKQAEEAVRRYAERLAAINRLDRIISSGLEITDIYDNFVKELLALIPLDRTAIVLLNETEDQWYIVRQWTQYEPVLTPDTNHPVQGSVIGWIVNNRIPFFENEVGEHSDWPESDILRREGIRSRLLLPLMIQDQVIGALTIASRQSNAISDEDQSILTAIADQLAIAIENSRLYTAVQQHAADLEKRVAARTSQLEASVKELEAFSYSVSHDLRAPLRAIDGFSRILLEEYASDLADNAQRYLRLVRDNAQQMGTLIDHLLAFSRLGRQSLTKEMVQLGDLVNSIWTDLNPEQEERDVRLVMGELPPVQADPTLLRQVFANLIENALKFTKTREQTVIEIGYQQKDGKPIYYVKDNGVGFDMQYAHKLFGVFQRLHRAEDFQGTGVGLATVQRIIHRHGGQIWVEAGVDRGATFFFTLNTGAEPDAKE